MKKIIALLLLVSLALCAFVACRNNDNNDDPSGETAKDYTLAIGVNVTNEGVEQTADVAVVVTDKDGKIVLCRLDSMIFNTSLDEDGALVTTAPTSKMELGDDYGMLTNNPYFGSSLAEWDDQAKFLETYVVGKTASEVASIETKEEGLATGCTMGVEGYTAAIAAAFASEHKVAFSTTGTLTAGVSVVGSITDETKDGELKVAYAQDYAGVVMVDGKVVASVIDSGEITVALSADDENKLTAEEVTYAGSKLAQGDDYGMLTNNPNFGSSLAEWYDQAQAFANTAVGKTASEVAELSTENVTGATMYLGGYKVALVKAAQLVR